MSPQDYEPRQSRSTTHFKFYSEKYLWGSTRSELLPDERAVWIDFLCLATMKFGEVEIFSRDQIAGQLLIERELLDRSIEKFIEHGKVERKYQKKEKKEIFKIVNWDRYQADYLKKRVDKSSTYKDKNRVEKQSNSDTGNQPTLDKTTKHNITPHKTTPNQTIPNHTKPNQTKEEEMTTKTSNYGGVTFSPRSDGPDAKSGPLPGSSFNSRKCLVDTLLKELHRISGYPFDEKKDRALLDEKLPARLSDKFINGLIRYLGRWTNHPEQLGDNPRKSLEDWLDTQAANGLGKDK